MTERFEMDAHEMFLEYSKDIEKACRIITRPQEHLASDIELAEDFLEEIRIQILAAINLETTDEEMVDCEDIMLGLYHYSGRRIPPNSFDEISLN